jgi:hypothetical protein
MYNPTTPKKRGASELSEALSPNGDNLANLCPDLASLMDDYRAQIEASRVWPVVGTYDNKSKPFKPFPRLPSELRQRVWELAARRPRVIEVIWQQKPFSTNPVPAVCHASSESRKYALIVYEKLILDKIDTGTYVNFELDTVFINNYRSSGHTMEFPELHEKCKKLAVLYIPWADLAMLSLWLARVMMTSKARERS